MNNNNPLSGNNAGVPPNTAGEQPPPPGNNSNQQPPPWQNTSGYAQQQSQQPLPPQWQDMGWQGYAPQQQPPPWMGMPYAQPQQPPQNWANIPPNGGMNYGQYNPQAQPQNPQAQDSQASAGFTAMLKQLSESAGLGDLGGLFAFDDKEFWKGAVVGAAAVLLLTNENVRETLMGGISKAASAVTPDTDKKAEPTAEKTATEESPNNSEES